MGKKLLLVLLLAPLGSSLASADELVMKNGSRLIGTLVSSGDGNLIFETPFAGQISVKTANVVSVNTDSSVTVMMKDGEIFRDKRIIASESTLTIKPNGGPERRYPIEEIDLVNPAPWLMGEGYNWTGDASVAFEAERGNSETDEWDLDANTRWRSLVDRYRLNARAEYDEANSNKVTENWSVNGRYDRFSRTDPDNYWGGGVKFEYDKFQDLDLRTTIGPHIGRQFFETDLLTLSSEFGPVWVDEKFDQAEDDSWPGLNWEVNAQSDILGFGTTLYAINDGTLNLDDTADTLINTTVGIKMPLILGFETKFEARYEYNGGAVEGTDDTDETYSVRVGYSW